MMTRRAFAAGLLGLLSAGVARASGSAHDFSFESIDGGPLRLADYAGKPVLVVNTASMCGFTPQYKGLQALHEEMAPRGLVVLAVPSNSFNQEHDSKAQIKEFCEVTYGLTLPMTEPVAVRGPEAHPFYVWANAQAGLLGAVKWNFHKFLIGPRGEFVDWFATTTPPDSPKLRAAIEKLLPVAPR